jgi:hypothetical protein
MMSTQDILAQLNHLSLTRKLSAGGTMPDHVRKRGWCGEPGATEEQILQLEARIDRSLPPSYREFLRASNGWWALNPFIWHLWSTENVDWFRVRHTDWIDAYRQPGEGCLPCPDQSYFVYGPGQSPQNIQVEYMKDLLEISDVGDSAILLLNPLVKQGEEWEVWFLADWSAGADRYRSFSEFLSYLIQEGESGNGRGGVI